MNKLYSILIAAGLFSTSVVSADIEFWYGNTGDPEIAIQTACNDYNQSQTQHTVKCVGQGSYEAGMQKAIASYRAKNHPVLIQFFEAGTLDLMLSDATIPVSTEFKDVNWNDYISGVRSYYETSQGELFSQPYNGSTLILYGNKEMFAKAGMTQLPNTWEEFEQATTKLKEAGIECPFTTDIHPWRILEQFSARHNVEIATKSNGYDGLDAEYSFNKGLVAEHLENLVTWRSKGLIKLDQETKAGEYQAAFGTAECAMMEGSTGSYAAARKALGDNILLGLAPVYKDYKRHNTLIGGASIWLMKGHSEEEQSAAKDFLDFLRSNEQQIKFTQRTGYVPVTQSVIKQLKESGAIEKPEFATVEIGVQSLNQPRGNNSRGVRLGFYPSFREIFQEEVIQAFNGDQTMQQALDNAVTRGNQLLRRFQNTYKNAPLP